MTGELITILRTRGPKLAKTWSADGKIADYDNAKTYTVKRQPVASLTDLHALLAHMQSASRSCIIRGAPASEIASGQVVERNLDTFADKPSKLFMVDVDNFRPMLYDVLDDPAGAVAEFVDTLPQCLREANYVWQLSGTCGHPSKGGVLRAHLWFWLQTAMDCEQAEAWAKKYVPDADATVHRTVQVNYTANPVMADGVTDPLAGRRLGFHGQALRDLLVIPADMPVPAVGEVTRVNRKERATAMVDPRDKPGVVGALCRAFEPTEIVTLFPEHFVAGDRDPTRITWLQGGGAKEGLKVADNGTHIYNSHSTAPVTHACNLFDFIRIHVFGQLDEDVEQDVLDLDITASPSYKATVAWALALPEVQAQLAVAVLDGGPVVTRETRRQRLPTRPGAEIRRGDVATLSRVLRQPALTGFWIGLDDFTGRLMLGGDAKPGSAWRPMRDTDYTRINERLQTHLGFGIIGKEVLREVVQLVGEENTFDSAQQWLALQVWDGVPRVADSLSRYFGATSTPYHEAVSRYLWTALAGRVLQPGAKADMVPIAVGVQGSRKSTTIAALVPDVALFDELDLGRRDDDTARRLQGRLVVELAELRGLRARDAASLKAFISLTADTWVEKYQSHPRTRPRRCVFIGSTNDQEFLCDSTGSRRWLPFEAGACDPDALIRDRDQLWAEGAAIFRGNGIAHQEAERLAQPEHDNYRVRDTWEEKIGTWLESGAAVDGTGEGPLQIVSTSEVLSALDIPTDRQTPHVQSRAASAMASLGWMQVRKPINGKKTRVWTRQV